jgi:hypothetical protein
VAEMREAIAGHLAVMSSITVPAALGRIAAL